MSTDQFLQSIIHKYRADDEESISYARKITPYIQQWAGKSLVSINYAGSISKHTTVSGGTNLDMLISLSPAITNTLSELYEGLYGYFATNRFKVKKQNVSIRFISSDYSNEYKLDLIPTKAESQGGGDNNLYHVKKNSTIQTSVNSHTQTILNSRRLDEIKLMKIWKDKNRVKFPTFYMELLIIKALSNSRPGDLTNNFRKVMQLLANDFASVRCYDPANPNNLVSDDLSTVEKAAVSRKAKATLEKTSLGDIFM